MSIVNRELLKRPLVWGSTAVVVVVGLAWWFAWMAPEASKLASVRAQQVHARLNATTLAAQLARLRSEATQDQAASPFLKRFGAAIPAQPDAPGLVVQAYRLAQRDHVTLESITDDTLESAGTGYSTIPVSMSISGGHDGVVVFVAGLYHLPRLITIQSLNLSGAANVLATGSAPYTATVTATAYTTYVVPQVGTTRSPGPVPAVSPKTG